MLKNINSVMNRTIIKKAIIVLLIVVLSVFFSTNVFAVESSNANLKVLGITPNDFTGFKENTTSYNVTVPNNVKQVKVYATAKDSSSTVTGTGNKELEEGKNKAEVIVKAKDGTTKTYTINIKRLKVGESETSPNITEANEDLGLNKLEIEGCNLEPSFSKDIHQYTVSSDETLKKLIINAEATSDDASVKIKGNTSLIKGQNIVTILVTDSNEKSVSTYQIYFNNSTVTPEQISKKYEEAKMSQEIKKWITIIISVIIIISLLSLKRVLRIRKKLRQNHSNNAKEHFNFDELEIEDDTQNISYNKNNNDVENNLSKNDDKFKTQVFNKKSYDYEDEELSESARKIRDNYAKINSKIENEARARERRSKKGRHSK